MRRRLDRTLRSLLVVTTIAAYGYWGWVAHDGWTRLVWSVGSMIVAATVWDSLRVRGDGVRPTVAVPGWVRLIVEAAYFTGAVASLAAAGLPELGFIYLLLIGIHYASTHERVVWLLYEGEGGG
jgi:hypothetical protein